VKKKNIFLSLFVGALSLATLASCGKTKDDKTTVSEIPTATNTSSLVETTTNTSTSVVDNNVVTEDVFDLYFDGYYSVKKFNIKYKYKDYGDSHKYDGTIEIADCMALSTFREAQETDDNELFYKINIYYDYLSVIKLKYDEGEWKDASLYVKDYEDSADDFYIPVLNFNDFNYNTLTSSYEAKEVVSNEVKYKDFSIKFEDNELVSYKYKIVGTETRDIEVEILQIGEVEIKDPTTNTVSKDVFNSYFYDFESLFKLNMRIDFSDRIEFVDENFVEINNGMALVEKENPDDSSSQKTFYRFNSCDKNDNAYFLEGKFNTLWENAIYKEINYSTLRQNIVIPLIKYDDATYNNDNNMYEVEELEYDKLIYRDVKIKFINNILCSYSFKVINKDNGSEYNYFCRVSSIGDIEIDNPYPNMVSSNVYDSYFSETYNGLKDLNITLDYSIDDDNSDVLGGTIKISNQMILNTYLLKNGNIEKKFMKITKFDSETYKYLFDVSYMNQEGTWSDFSSEEYSSFDLSKYIFLPPFSFNILIYNYDTNVYDGDVYIVGTDFSEIKMKFLNDKLVLLSYICDGVSIEVAASDIGETLVVDPRIKS